MMMMMMIVGSVRERGSDDDGGWVCEREREVVSEKIIKKYKRMNILLNKYVK